MLSADGEKSLGVSLERDEKRTNRWRLSAERYELVRNPGRAWELPKPVQFYGFPDEAALYYQNTAFLADLELTFQDQLERVRYLGPLRSSPERLYTWTGNQPEDVGWQGAGTVAALLSSDARRFNWTEKARTKSLQAVVADWLQKLGLLTSFAVVPIAPDRDVYEVRVRTSRQSEEVMLPDVGFGVAQVLPVVVESFYAAPGAVVLMEQPEIHLHPAVQSAIADMFIAAINAREHGRRRGVQFIVESHSEHLLRRLQRRIAEQSLDHGEIALYFCEPGPKGSRIERLEVDEYGDIANWPQDFFGNEMEDVLAQARWSADRRVRAEA
jgi:predicted ATPase